MNIIPPIKKAAQGGYLMVGVIGLIRSVLTLLTPSGRYASKLCLGYASQSLVEPFTVLITTMPLLKKHRGGAL